MQRYQETNNWGIQISVDYHSRMTQSPMKSSREDILPKQYNLVSTENLIKADLLCNWIMYIKAQSNWRDQKTFQNFLTPIVQ